MMGRLGSGGVGELLQEAARAPLPATAQLPVTTGCPQPGLCRGQLVTTSVGLVPTGECRHPSAPGTDSTVRHRACQALRKPFRAGPSHVPALFLLKPKEASPCARVLRVPGHTLAWACCLGLCWWPGPFCWVSHPAVLVISLELFIDYFFSFIVSILFEIYLDGELPELVLF